MWFWCGFALLQVAVFVFGNNFFICSWHEITLIIKPQISKFWLTLKSRRGSEVGNQSSASGFLTLVKDLSLWTQILNINGWQMLIKGIYWCFSIYATRTTCTITVSLSCLFVTILPESDEFGLDHLDQLKMFMEFMPPCNTNICNLERNYIKVRVRGVMHNNNFGDIC